MQSLVAQSTNINYHVTARTFSIHISSLGWPDVYSAFWIFWKLRKFPLKWCVSIQNFVRALICHFSASNHGLYIIHGTAKLANTFISQIWTLMIPFERYFCKLSENPKIFDFGSTEFKFMAVERFKLNGGGGGVVEHLSIAITWVLLIQCQKFVDFLKA